MLAGSINVTLVGKSSRIIMRFSVRSSSDSTKPNQYITNPGPNLKQKNYICIQKKKFVYYQKQYSVKNEKKNDYSS